MFAVGIDKLEFQVADAQVVIQLRLENMGVAVTHGELKQLREALDRKSVV